MANIFEISLSNPVRFYPATNSPGGHFDDDWWCKQIKDFERRVYYQQKWQKSDQIPIQMLSTFTDCSVKIYDINRQIVGGTNGALITSDAAGTGLYHANVQLNSLAEGVYYLVAISKLLNVSYTYISEPILVKTTHKNTTLFKYTNTLNDFGLVFSAIVESTGDPYVPEFTFRCEAAVMHPDFKRVRSSYRDQILNTTTLSATPFRQLKLYVGDHPGVAPWVIDLLNMIFCCDNVQIDNMSKGKYLQYETPEGSEWETARQKGYPLVWGTLDLVPAKNRSSQQLSSEEIPGGGMLVAYDIETQGFGQADPSTILIENVD